MSLEVAVGHSSMEVTGIGGPRRLADFLTDDVFPVIELGPKVQIEHQASVATAGSSREPTEDDRASVSLLNSLPNKTLTVKLDSTLNTRMRSSLLGRFTAAANDARPSTALGQCHAALAAWSTFRNHFNPPSNASTSHRPEFLFPAVVISVLLPLTGVLYVSPAFPDTQREVPIPAWRFARCAGRGTGDMELRERRVGLECKTTAGQDRRLVDAVREESAAVHARLGPAGSVPDSRNLLAGDVERVMQICREMHANQWRYFISANPFEYTLFFLAASDEIHVGETVPAWQGGHACLMLPLPGILTEMMFRRPGETAQDPIFIPRRTWQGEEGSSPSTTPTAGPHSSSPRRGPPDPAEGGKGLPGAGKMTAARSPAATGSNPVPQHTDDRPIPSAPKGPEPGASGMGGQQQRPQSVLIEASDHVDAALGLFWETKLLIACPLRHAEPGAPPSPPLNHSEACATKDTSGVPGSLVLSEKIGGGGFSAVYRAKSDWIDCQAVVKITTIARAGPEASTKRDMIVHEGQLYATTLSQVQGRVVPRFFGVYTIQAADADIYATVLEDVGLPVGDEAAQTWASLPRGDRLTIKDLYESLHNTGVVHRDVAMRNIMKSASGDIRLVDFGHAQLITVAGEAGREEEMDTVCYLTS